MNLIFRAILIDEPNVTKIYNFSFEIIFITRSLSFVFHWEMRWNLKFSCADVAAQKLQSGVRMVFQLAYNCIFMSDLAGGKCCGEWKMLCKFCQFYESASLFLLDLSRAYFSSSACNDRKGLQFNSKNQKIKRGFFLFIPHSFEYNTVSALQRPL